MTLNASSSQGSAHHNKDFRDTTTDSLLSSLRQKIINISRKKFRKVNNDNLVRFLKLSGHSQATAYKLTQQLKKESIGPDTGMFVPLRTYYI